MLQTKNPSSTIVDKSKKNKHNQTILIRQRMMKVHQRELLLSNGRQNYCVVTSKRSADVSSLTSSKIKSFLCTSFNQELHKSDSLIQAEEMKKSREFIKKVKKISKDSYGKKRKSPPVSDQLRDLSNHIANLDMEWNDFGTVLQTTTYLRKLLSIERNPPIEHVIHSGAVPYFLQYLDEKQVQKFFNIDNLDDSGKRSISRSDMHRLQFEAAWAITNIANGSPDNTRYVVELGCIPALINLLESENVDVIEQCVWALGNIGGTSATMRDLVLDNGALPKLLKIIASEAKISFTRNAVWTLSNLLRGKPIVPFEIVSTALPILSHLLFHLDEEVLTDACWAISYASDGPNERIQAVIDNGIVRRVVELLHHSSVSIQTPALRILGNLVTGNDIQTLTLLNFGLLNNLKHLLSHPKNGIRKEALWTISNITASNKDQIQMVIDSGIIPNIITILASGFEVLEVKKEGYWTLANLCANGRNEQIKYAIEVGAVESFCDGIKVNDVKIIQVALEGIKSITLSAKEHSILEKVKKDLKEYGAMDKISELQNSEDYFIKESSTKILEKLIMKE